MTPDRSIYEILTGVFGFPSFREGQEEIIGHVMQGGDALVVMPTGAGKSLCYQIPALCRGGMGVVVSPLIALMRDQVEALNLRGVRAAALHSALSLEEMETVTQSLREGSLDLLYVAPERLLMPRTMALLKERRLSLFAIDEAHCVVQWGHDFRPEYLRLRVLGERFPDVPCLALTATADETMRQGILEGLGINEAHVFVTPGDRLNIRHIIKRKTNPRAQILQFLKKRHAKESGIIYCFSRAGVEETASWLTAAGFNALPYHAGLAPTVRSHHQDYFLKTDGVIMVATIAFGMGIDKSNVRFVIHQDMPRSLESYHQETGRAGRDGLPAEALLLYAKGDAEAYRGMIWAGKEDVAQKDAESRRLEAMIDYCEKRVGWRGLWRRWRPR